MMKALSLILLLSFAATRPQAGEPPDFVISPAERATVIRESLEKLRTHYIFPEAVTRMKTALRQRERRQEYQSISSARELAIKLTEDLRQVSNDSHLRVLYYIEGAPPDPLPEGPTPEDLIQMSALGAKQNFGFQKVEILEGNVGLLEIHGFYPGPAASKAAAAALTFLGNADALILDLRKTRGGDPTGVANVLSYFFESPVQVMDIEVRWPNVQRQEIWTTAAVDGTKFGSRKPIYVLASQDTFSGGEAFAFALRMNKRAQILGETTRGGAHLTVPLKVFEHFRIGIPYGRTIDPATQTDWEGTGVPPDIQVNADRSLTEAHKLALSELAGSRMN